MAKRSRKPSESVNKSLETWIWDAACSIRGARDAPKYKDYILPLIFTKRLCDVFDDELDRIAKEIGSRKKAFALVKADPKLVRFYLPLVHNDPEQPVWSVIRKFAEGGGQSAGEFYTSPDVGTIMSRVLQPEPGMTVYDPCCGSGGLLVKLDIAMEDQAEDDKPAPFRLYCQEYIADTLIGWKEEERLSRIVNHADLAKNDYNISPSRYIHTSDAETYRPIAKIVEALRVIEA